MRFPRVLAISLVGVPVSLFLGPSLGAWQAEDRRAGRGKPHSSGLLFPPWKLTPTEGQRGVAWWLRQYGLFMSGARLAPLISG